MKRIFTQAAACLLIVCLTACGGKTAPGASSQAPASSAVSAPGASSAPASSSQEPQMPTAAQLGRDEHSTLEMTVEGQTESVPVTLRVGQSGSGFFSVYLPDDGWEQKEPGLWCASDNGDVVIYAELCGGTADSPMTARRCYDGIVSQYGNSGSASVKFGPLDGNFFQGARADTGAVREVWLTEDGTDCWAVYGLYPADAAEGFSARLPVLAATFQPGR